MDVNVSSLWFWVGMIRVDVIINMWDVGMIRFESGFFLWVVKLGFKCIFFIKVFGLSVLEFYLFICYKFCNL